MTVNASVVVIKGNVDKALRALEDRLRKQGLWKYDPTKRYETKKNKGLKKTK